MNKSKRSSIFRTTSANGLFGFLIKSPFFCVFTVFSSSQMVEQTGAGLHPVWAHSSEPCRRWAPFSYWAEFSGLCRSSDLWPFPCTECYSEASDHEEAESTEIPPPPYTDQSLQDSGGPPGPPGGTHQVSRAWTPPRTSCVRTEHAKVFFLLSGDPPSSLLLGRPGSC